MAHLTPNEEYASWNFNSDVFPPFSLLFNRNTNLCILVWKIVKQGELDTAGVRTPLKQHSCRGLGRLGQLLKSIWLHQFM